MSRRARISWLLSATTPMGRAVMSARRMQVLAAHHTTAGFVLDPGGGAPRGSTLRALRPARGMAGEARLARSDVIVSTDDSTVASAVTRAGAHTRVVHVLHDPPGRVLAAPRFMRSIPRVDHVVVPLSVDPADFAARAGLSPRRVTATDDFVLEHESLLGSARARVAMVVGRRVAELADVIDAFGHARLVGWHLRVFADRRATAILAEHVSGAGLDGRVLLLGERHDLASHYAQAGVVIKLDPDDVNGLSVIESLAAGVPVLGGSQVPAVRRLVRDGHNGLVLDRIDRVAVAEGLVAMADADRRATLARNARDGRTGLLSPAGEDELHQLFAHILDKSVRRGGDE